MGTIDAVELRQVLLPMLEPFRTRAGTQTERPTTIVRVIVDGVEGWGELAATPEPTYTTEWAGGAAAVLREQLVPRLLAGAPLDEVHAPMARAALESALLDSALRHKGISLGSHLGVHRDRVTAGVAVGFAPTVGELVATVERHLAVGYRRVKVKIRPGWDVEPLRAVRAAVGDTVAVQADANGAYDGDDTSDVAALHAVDDLGLLLIEQPLPPGDLVGSARLAKELATRICLDESIGSADHVRTAAALGAASVICLKPARVGGIDAAVEVHDAAVAAGLDLWCGGMLETGIGRGVLLALAALPGCTLAGDLSATGRWYADDLTPPVFLDADGMLPVPTESGCGPVPDAASLAAVTVAVETLRP
ncbi:MAG: o-succinylbenzoate synthase [Acidimicrobiaceae bacterium]|jgi:O-succinylbenzoate synthase